MPELYQTQQQLVNSDRVFEYLSAREFTLRYSIFQFSLIFCYLFICFLLLLLLLLTGQKWH